MLTLSGGNTTEKMRTWRPRLVIRPRDPGDLGEVRFAVTENNPSRSRRRARPGIRPVVSMCVTDVTRRIVGDGDGRHRQARWSRHRPSRGAFGDVADRHVGNSEETRLFLNRAAVGEHAEGFLLQPDEVEEPEWFHPTQTLAIRLDPEFLDAGAWCGDAVR